MVNGNNSEGDVVGLLRNTNNGLTITEIVRLSKFSRSTIRVILARLEGANEVSFREIGMAKVYIMESVEHEIIM